MAFNTKLRFNCAKFWQDPADTIELSGSTSVGSAQYLETLITVGPLTIPTAAWVTGQTGAIDGANGLSRVDGNIVLGGSLTGATKINGAQTLNINISNFNVTGATNIQGAVGMTSTLAVAGATDINNTLNVLNATSLQGTLKVTGATTLTSLAASGAIDANSTLNVLNATSLQGTLNVTGATTITSLAASGAADLNSTLNVLNATSLQGTLNVTGATSLCSTVTLPTVAGGTTANPIMVLDSGVVKCVAASSYNVTAVNGITATGNQVKLGGTTPLCEATNICGATFAMSLGTAASKLGAFQVNANSAAIISDTTAGVTAAGIITLNSTASCVLLSSITKYDANCASQYDLRSIPDVAYVTGLTSQSILTAANGLTKTAGRAVELGGALTKNTCIGGSFRFGVHGTVINVTGDTSVNLGGPVALKTYPAAGTGNILTYNATTGVIEHGTKGTLGLITGGTNGIGEILGDVCLGGTLSAPTTISGAQLLTLGALNGICLYVANGCNIEINGQSEGNVIVKSQSGTIGGTSFTNGVGFNFDYNNTNNQMLVYDNSPSCRGLQYADDYSTTFCDNSLVTKYYVDSIATGLNVHAAVAVATTVGGGNLPLSGNTGTVDGLVVSGFTGILNRILVKNQTDATENGIYSATTGAWGRTEDYNFAPPGEIANGDLVPVSSGNTNANSQWINVSVNPVISGSTDILFSLFAQQQGVIGGDGIEVTTVGTNRSVAVDLASSQCGLTLAGTKLALDFTIFSSGLTESSGTVSVNASQAAIAGNCIAVKFDATCQLVVDSGDFSYTTAANGLHKDGCNVVLGGSLTGNCAITMAGTTGLAFTDSRSATIGLQYSDAYKAGFTIHSLVDADFVTGLTSAGITTASNGLTATGQEVKLGGGLTQLTRLTGAQTIDFNISNFNVTGATVFEGNVSVNEGNIYDNGALNVAGASSLQGTLDVTGDTSVTTFDASGAVDLNSTLNVLNGTSLQGTLDVTGDTSITTLDASGAVDLNSTLNVAGASSLQGALVVTGATTLCSTVTLPTVAAGASSNPIMVLDSGVVKCVSASSFDVSASNGLNALSNEVRLGGSLTGNTKINGAHNLDINVTQFNVTGATDIQGAVAMSSTLAVAGATDINNTLNVLNGASIQGTLNVTGASTITSLAASGAADLNSTLNVLNATSLQGTLKVTGATTITSLAASGAADLNSTLNVLNGTSLQGTLKVTGATTLGGAVDINNTLNVLNATSLQGTLAVTGNTTLSGTTGIKGALTLYTTAAGDAVNDSVLTINAAGVVRKVSGSALGEDNNRYTIDVVTTNITLPTTGYTILVSGATALTLPAGVNGMAYKIKDACGNALADNISVVGTIDGSANASINTDYGALELVYSSALGEWYSLAFIN